MVSIGVIGCGRIAQVRHLPEYACNSDAHIAAVCSLNKERAASIGSQYGARVYSSYEELLADPDIDAVSVCTSNTSHCEISVKALRSGKHVLCEKPMATTLDECELMISAANETGKHLMIAHNQRFAQAHIEAKELIAQGAIGKILTFRTAFCHKGPESWTIDPDDNWFFDKSRAAFGVMADLGVHKIDLLHFLTGRRITGIHAAIGTFDKSSSDGRRIDLDDNAVCICKMDDGAIGTLTVSWTCYGREENSTVLYGTNGVMRIYDDPVSPLIIEHKDGNRTVRQTEKIATNETQTKSGVIDSWIRSLTTGNQPEIPAEESLYAMKVVFASFASTEGLTY